MKPILNERQIADIARRYDGTTHTINELVKEYGVLRHNITSAAKRGGYKSPKKRITWDEEKDQYLRDNWGKLPPAEIYAHLECNPSAIFNRLKRIGHSTRNNEDLTIYELEHLTKLDHRLWLRFIDRGWLKSYPEYGRNGEVWSRRVKVEWLGAFLKAHPEVIDYRKADKYARVVLELDKLPDPPKFMLLTCHSDSWQDGIRATPVGRKIHHGEIEITEREHHYELDSCAAMGGTDVWAPIYKNSVNCPRCGCLLGRFSEKAVFSEEDPGEGDLLNAIAGKLGLRWKDGQFFDASGQLVSEEELLRYVFNTKRNAGRAFATFRRLLEAGMSVAPPNPVQEGRLLSNILRFELRDAQEAVFVSFLESGNVGVYWPPGMGKMYFLGTVYSRIAGEHALFVHTDTIREQWLEFFKEQGNVRITKHRAPMHSCVEVLDDTGAVRSQVRIYSYSTREQFEDGRFVVVGFDEAQFLPGNRASRLSMLKSDFRVGLSATPFREDGRADLIQLMTGTALGEDWQEFKDAGYIPDVPVHVVIVSDLEQKHQALASRLKGHKTIVFSDSVEDGKRISCEIGIPFIYSATKNRLKVLNQHQAVVMSRVGDCGIDTRDVEEVIEFNFHHGSRAQSLQRMGRLLHSRKPLRHTVMMTFKEFSLYHKRLSALEAKGFPIRIEMYQEKSRRGRPPKPKPVNEWAVLLGAVSLPKPPKGIAATSRRKYESGVERRERAIRSTLRKYESRMEVTA